MRVIGDVITPGRITTHPETAATLFEPWRRDGSTGRRAADEEVTAAARVLRAAEVRGMVIDTSPRPHQRAEALALNLGALYLPLPHADALALRNAVQGGTA